MLDVRRCDMLSGNFPVAIRVALFDWQLPNKIACVGLRSIPLNQKSPTDFSMRDVMDETQIYSIDKIKPKVLTSPPILVLTLIP